MFESVNAQTDGRTHRFDGGPTPARVSSYKLTLKACGSGELKSHQLKHLESTLAIIEGYVPKLPWYILSSNIFG